MEKSHRTITNLAVICSVIAIQLFSTTVSVSGSSFSNAPCPVGCQCNQQGMVCNYEYTGNEMPDLIRINRTDIVGMFFFHCRYSVQLPLVSYTWAETLTFDDCGIGPSITNRSLVSMTRLRSLTITGNRHLTNVDALAFAELTNLEELDLSDNDIAKLPDYIFAGMNRLQLLDLSGNKQLRSVPVELFGKVPPSFTQFMCNECGMESIPIDLLVVATNLTRLELNRNNLTTALVGELVRPFATLRQLTALSLDQSKLTAIASDAFYGLESALQSLRLGHNDISRINESTLAGLAVLKRLELDNNKLTRLKKVALPITLISSAGELFLGNNPWTCDGDLLWLNKLGKNSTVDSENVKCSEPELLFDQQLFSLNNRSFTQTSERVCTTSSAATVAIVFSSVGLAAVAFASVYRFCTYRKKRRSPSRYSNVERYDTRSGEGK